MAILEVKNVSKRFGGLWAIKNVSLEVNVNEILGIIGPNGSGKTTLFNVISGYYKPDGGSVIFDGKDITGLPPYTICKEGIARTFQLTKPFSELTALDNVTIGALLRYKIVDEARKEAYRILELTGLEHKKDALGKDLTIIERKRLELAKALATKPRVLLLDEVMAGLKPAEIGEVLSIIRNIRESGITLLVVEHVMRAIMTLCDRMIVLDYGEKIAEGKPEEIGKSKLVIKAYLGEEYIA